MGILKKKKKSEPVEVEAEIQQPTGEQQQDGIKVYSEIQVLLENIIAMRATMEAQLKVLEALKEEVEKGG